MPRDFRFVCAGNLISNLGSWLLVVALPYQVFRVSDSIAATGLTLAAESVPALVIGPVAGLLVDRWDRRWVMIASNLVSAAAVAGLLAGLPWLYLAVFLENVGVVFFRPAARALIPAILGTGPRLVRGNSLIAFNNGIVRLIGPPLGAILGMPTVVWTDIGSYAASAILITLIRPISAPGTSGFELLAGIRHSWQHLRRLLLINTTFFTANAVYTALLIPFMTGRFGHHPATIGLFLSALGVDYLAGTPIAARLVNRYRAGPLLRIAQIGVALAFLTLITAENAAVAITAGGLIGIPGSLLIVTIETTIQRASPEALRGRVGATFFASDALAALLGALIGATSGTIALPVSAGVILLSALTSLDPVDNGPGR